VTQTTRPDVWIRTVLFWNGLWNVGVEEMVCLDTRLAVAEMFWEDAGSYTKGDSTRVLVFSSRIRNPVATKVPASMSVL